MQKEREKVVSVMVSGRERQDGAGDRACTEKPGKAGLRFQASFYLSVISCFPQLVLTPYFAKRQLDS